MQTIEIRLIRKEIPDNKGHKFPVFYCKYLNSKGQIKYKDVTINKDIVNKVTAAMTDNTVDLRITISENMDEKDADAFKSWKSKLQKDGSYKYVKDEKTGQKIPKFILNKFSESNILPVDIDFPIETWNIDD